MSRFPRLQVFIVAMSACLLLCLSFIASTSTASAHKGEASILHIHRCLGICMTVTPSTVTETNGCISFTVKGTQLTPGDKVQISLSKPEEVLGKVTVNDNGKFSKLFANICGVSKGQDTVLGKDLNTGMNGRYTITIV